MRITTEFLRKDNLFLHPDTNQILRKFDSVSKAKKESRILQSENGGLGRGYIKALDTRDQKDAPKPVIAIGKGLSQKTLEKIADGLLADSRFKNVLAGKPTTERKRNDRSRKVD